METKQAWLCDMVMTDTLTPIRRCVPTCICLCGHRFFVASTLLLFHLVMPSLAAATVLSWDTKPA